MLGPSTSSDNPALQAIAGKFSPSVRTEIIRQNACRHGVLPLARRRLPKSWWPTGAKLTTSKQMWAKEWCLVERSERNFALTHDAPLTLMFEADLPIGLDLHAFTHKFCFVPKPPAVSCSICATPFSSHFPRASAASQGFAVRNCPGIQPCTMESRWDLFPMIFSFGG